MIYDIAVIGAGPGGYSAAIRAAKNEAKVILIEEDEYGGTCLNRGCIPTKAILKSASVFKDIKKAQGYGISLENSRIDLFAVIERKNKVVSGLRNGLIASFKALDIECIKEKAKIIGKNKIIAGGREINAEKIIIAAGSSPAKPVLKGIDSKFVIYSDEVLELVEIPESMVIIGGGVLGLEFAYFFNQIGTKVTVIEMKKNVLPGFDHEIASEISKLLVRQKIEIITEAIVKEINNDSVVFEESGEIQTRKGEKILISIGRTPNTKELFDDGVDIKMEKGYIHTDSYMRTNIENIYAVGDVNGKEMLAHTAIKEGVVAADNACGKEIEMNYNAIPKCVYTQPEIAWVGMTEEEVSSKNIKYIKSKVLVRTNGRAHADGNIDGFIKTIAEEETGKILGVHIIAPYATEMIAESVMALNIGLTYKEMDEVIHPHPTVSEIIEDTVIGLQ